MRSRPLALLALVLPVLAAAPEASATVSKASKRVKLGTPPLTLASGR